MLQAKSAQKRQTAIPLKRRNPVDGTLVIILIMLLLAGLLVLFSATFYTGTSTRSPYSEVLKQLLGIGLGTAACIVTSRIPYRCWQHPYVVVGGLALSAVLLVLVIIPGVGVYINGSRRWLSLGGLSFQPSEIAKFAVVLYMATTLTYRGERIRRLFTGIVPALVVPGGRIPADSGAAEPVHRGVNPHRQPDSHHHGGREVAAYSADAHRRAGCGRILRMVGAVSAAASAVLSQSLFHDER